MKQFVLFSLFFHCLCSSAQPAALNYTDPSGLRQGHWIYYGGDPEFTDVPDTVKTEEGNYLNGLKDGEWIRYEPDGRKYMVVTYKYGKEAGFKMIPPERNAVREKTDAREIFREESGLSPQINQCDDENRKQGHWICYGKDRPETGIPDSGKVEEGAYVNDRKEGLWKKYYNDGKTVKLSGEYADNRPSGPYTKYDGNGNVKERGTFIKNHFRDTLSRYDANGNVIFQKVYDTLGNVQQTPVPYKPEQTKPAVPPGDPRKFNQDSYNKVYNDDKLLWQEGTFKDGELWDGKAYIYNKEGILMKIQLYKNGVNAYDRKL